MLLWSWLQLYSLQPLVLCIPRDRRSTSHFSPITIWPTQMIMTAFQPQSSQMCEDKGLLCIWWHLLCLIQACRKAHFRVRKKNFLYLIFIFDPYSFLEWFNISADFTHFTPVLSTVCSQYKRLTMNILQKVKKLLSMY